MEGPSLQRRIRRLRTVTLLAVAVGAACLAFLADRAGALRPLELRSVDTRFRLRGDRPPDPRLPVGAVDEASLARLPPRWPLPRGMHADVIDALRRAGARVIVYD